jgi:hypothetical protein
VIIQQLTQHIFTSTKNKATKQTDNSPDKIVL